MKVFIERFVLVALLLNVNLAASAVQISYYKTVFNFIKNKADVILENAVQNTQCASDLRSLFTDLASRKKWALEMVDASGKGSSGMMSGNFYIAGSFDQCMNIHEIRDETTIDGQYCTVVLTPSKTFSSDINVLFDTVAMTNYMGFNMSYHADDILKLIKLTYGLCIPHSCSIGHLQKIWDYIEYTLRIPVHLLFVDILCRSREKPIEPYSIDKYVYACFGIYLCIMLASTWYDVMIYQHLEVYQKQQYHYWILFSIYTNTKKLLSHTPWYEAGCLECINGIKVLTMLWIIFGHRIALNALSGNVNGLYIFQWKRNIENSFIIGASFSVDTFLVLSGLLISYSFLQYKRILRAEGNMPFKSYYIHRFLRLSPALLATILFSISIFKNISDGPFWPIVAKKVGGSCLRSWWATLFFATNLIDFNYQCLEHSWYLAVDTQLYIISPIILMHLEKRPWRTISACLGACVVSAIYTFVVTINYNYGAIYFEGNNAYHKYIYQPTFVRMPPWLIGIILGYFVSKYQEVRIPKGANLFLWFSSLSLMIYLILIHLAFTRNHYDPVRSALFNSCARSAWAIALSLIIFSCISGHGGMVNQFLSLPIFQLLVKLSYSTYLVNLSVILYFVGGKKHPGYFSNISGVHDFMGDLFFIFMVATIWCLLFESPFLALSKKILNRDFGRELVISRAESKKMKRRRKYEMDKHILKDFQKIN